MKVPFEIDYVFPWVNDGDPVWRKTYEDYCIKTQSYIRLNDFHNERFRDWGLLRYLFRSIAQNMPWIRKVHLIVSNSEQVPQWVNEENINVVLHKDIMPEKYLPTFNSTAIEMFIPDIPDLAEHFIYANDDMFPINPTEPSDWFTEDGRPKYNMRELDAKKATSKQFSIVCSRQWWIMNDLLHINTTRTKYKRPWHCAIPMVKAQCFKARELLGDKLKKSISHFRTAENFNQYIYANYCDLIGYRVDSEIDFTYVGAKGLVMLDTLKNCTSQVICVNDCDSKMISGQVARLQILTAQVFNEKFPDACKYEK